MPDPGRVAEAIKDALVDVGLRASAHVGDDVAVVVAPGLTLWVYRQNLSWTDASGARRRYDLRGVSAGQVLADMAKLFGQFPSLRSPAERAALSLAVERLLTRFCVSGAEAFAETATDGWRAVVYVHAEDRQVAVTVVDGTYRWRDRAGEPRQLPWAQDTSAPAVADEVVEQLAEEGGR